MCNSQGWCLGEAGANLGLGNPVFQPQAWETWCLKHSLETVNSLNSKSNANIGAVFLQDVSNVPLEGPTQTYTPHRALSHHPDLQELAVVRRTMGTTRHGAETGGRNDGDGEV